VRSTTSSRILFNALLLLKLLSPISVPALHQLAVSERDALDCDLSDLDIETAPAFRPKWLTFLFS
jgi:hypothetical protein